MNEGPLCPSDLAPPSASFCPEPFPLPSTPQRLVEASLIPIQSRALSPTSVASVAVISPCLLSPEHFSCLSFLILLLVLQVCFALDPELWEGGAQSCMATTGPTA